MSITPPDEIFRNLENAKRFAIDIGRRGLAQGAGRRGQAWARAAETGRPGWPAGRGGGAGRWCRTACPGLVVCGGRRVQPISHVVCGLPARLPPRPDCGSQQAPRGRSRACRGSQFLREKQPGGRSGTLPPETGWGGVRPPRGASPHWREGLGPSIWGQGFGDPPPRGPLFPPRLADAWKRPIS